MSTAAALTETDWVPADRDLSVATYVSLSSAGIVDSDYRPLRGGHAPWVNDVFRSLRGSMAVGSERTSRLARESLLRVLTDSVWTDAPTPFVSPTEDGGVSAEFRSGVIELHLEADRRGARTVYVFSPDTEWEGPVDLMPDGLEKWAWRLSHAV